MSTRRLAYYPGCTQHGSAEEYDVATRLVYQKLGVELEEIENWTCCGASSAHMTSQLLGHALAARNLQLVEETGTPVTTPCPACFSRLKFATHDLADPKLLENVCIILGKEFRNSVDVIPVLGVISANDVEPAVRRPLTGLRTACYYGCATVRPQKVLAFDDEENPQSMDRLLRAAGAETLDWAFKTECCGASLTVTRPETVCRLSGRILRAARRAGADCVAVACPMCHGNLDQRQAEIGRAIGERVDIPVLYFSQLLGIAMGFSFSQLMIGKHLTNARPMLLAKGLL